MPGNLSIYLHYIYEVIDQANHILSESLSSGNDNDQDEYLQKDKYKDKDTHTQTKTNTKCLQDPMYALFFKSRGFEDIKYGIPSKIVHQTFSTQTFHQKNFHNNFLPNVSHQNQFPTCS